VDADHDSGYVEDKARTCHCHDSSCEAVREEQDGTHCKRHGLTVLFHLHFLVICLALCVAAVACAVASENWRLS
jgi:hypothetical protein